MQKTITLHSDKLAVLEDITNEQRGELFYAIKKYNDGVDIELSPMVKVLFAPFVEQFKQEEISRRKGKRVVFTPPTIEEIAQFSADAGYAIDATLVYNYYNDADWHDSRGNKVKSWKQKLRAVWFKEDKRFLDFKNMTYDQGARFVATNPKPELLRKLEKENFQLYCQLCG